MTNNGDENPSAIPSLIDTLTGSPTTWSESPGVISVTQINPDGLSLLFSTAQQMRTLVRENGGGDDRLRNKILATVFYEASTRTSCSFQAAMMRLGGKVLHIDGSSSGNSSAGKKGETLSDTLKCLECYSDVIVLRHPQIGAARNVVQKDTLKKPLLNAGDGAGEHPTQALLDLFTIYDELKIPFSSPTPPPPQSIVDTSESASEHLNIVLLGDLKHGRTVHSLAKLLARCVASPKMKSITLRYCSPTSLQMPDQVKNYVKNYPNTIIREQEDYTDLKEAIKGANILYVTRVQKERFQNLEDYEAVKVRRRKRRLLCHSSPTLILFHRHKLI